jgi:ribosome-associated toxin RatA of RatAB toxin-antitoxin module
MRELTRSALVGLPAARLYALINDIESYPDFLPWCTSASVQTRTATEIVATVGIRRGALNSRFTTRNTLEPQRRVRMHLVNGPFKTLEGEWRLTPVEGLGCRVELTLKFAFSNRFTAVVMEPLFEGMAAQLVDAFVARARQLGGELQAV